MTQSRKLMLGAIGAAAALSAPACAQDARPLGVVLSVGAATDYEFRGVSQTDNRGQVFGAADAMIGSLGYAGAWVSNIDFQHRTGMEYDLYGGVRPMLGPVTVDLGVVRYGYASQPSDLRKAYTEWKVAPSMALGPATVGLAYAYSDDLFGRLGPASYGELNASMPIEQTPFSVSGAVGRQSVKGPLDYSTWNLGVSYALNSHVGFDLRYWDTDQHGLGAIYDSKLVLGVKATFP